MSVGILGFGRFGKALGGLLEEHGHAYSALDPGATVPKERRSPHLEDLISTHEFIAVAVPVPALRHVLATVAPLLRPHQVLFDVGSVKTGPFQWMEELLGTAPHVGTHPLFGPVSLARAERPLRVVLCPSPRFPGAAARVGGLFASLGCEVLEQSPEDHDRVMASTHALTFFLAKGLLEVGAGSNLPFAPPSFHAIQRTLESVRGDAGHLFATLQNENPFALSAREGLLEALQAIHRNLAEAALGPQPGEASAPSLDIPDLGSRSPALQEVREHIDALDQELLDLLARRAELSRRAARAKATLGAPVLDPAREASLLQERRHSAESLGLDPTTAEEVFRVILRGSRAAQA